MSQEDSQEIIVPYSISLVYNIYSIYLIYRRLILLDLRNGPKIDALLLNKIGRFFISGTNLAIYVYRNRETTRTTSTKESPHHD